MANAFTSSGTSRLDRLIILLDTGSTSNIRKAAGKQIGDLVKSHPQEAIPLINRVKKFLCSKVWETRVAAAQAIGAIVEHIGHPTVDELIALAESVWERHGMVGSLESGLSAIRSSLEAEMEEKQNLLGNLSFEAFSLIQVLERGAPLLASAGKEFDLARESGQSHKEKIANQRRNLQKRLGMEGCEQFMDMREVIRDEDLLQGPDSLNSRGQTKEQAHNLVTSIASQLNRSLSARERNLLKRKARGASSKGPSWKDAEEKPEAKRAKGADMEAVEEEETELDKQENAEDSSDIIPDEAVPGIWPLEQFCEELLLNMFSPVWEVRHGNIMALREIFSFQTKRACVYVPPLEDDALLFPASGGPDGAGHSLSSGTSLWNYLSAVDKSVRANLDFQQDCAVRLITILALDRFGDYVSDQVVAPVRETCAQALGSLSMSMSPALVRKTLNTLLQMQGQPEWEVRHGCMLGVKYLVAVRQDLVPEFLPSILPFCISSLEDADDDVKALAAESLVPIVKSLVQSCSCPQAKKLLRLLWDMLQDLDELSPLTASVMNVLSELYRQPELPGLLATPSVRDDDSLADQDSDLSDAEDEVPGLDSLVPRLWPLLAHKLPNVRKAAVLTLERLLESSAKKGKEGVSWLRPVLEGTLRIVLQSLLLEKEAAIQESILSMWQTLLKAAALAGQATLRTSSASHFPSWLKLMATPTGTAIEKRLLFVPGGHAPAKPGKKGADPLATDSQFVLGEAGDGAGMSSRLIALKAMGQFLSFWPPLHLDAVVAPLHGMIKSDVSLHRQVSAIAICYWFQFVRRQGEAPAPDPDRLAPIRSSLTQYLSCTNPAQPTPRSASPYSELSRTYSKLKLEVQSLVVRANELGLHHDFTSDSLSSIGADSAANLAEKISAQSDSASFKQKSGSSYDLLEACRQQVVTTASYLKSVEASMHRRALASFAGALVWMDALPDKLNPIIQPLTAAIKKEKDEALQKLAAACLARVVVCCESRSPGPTEKLVRNVCIMACAECPTLSAANENVDPEEVKEGDGKGGGLPDAAKGNAEVEAAVMRQGAEMVLRSIAEEYGDQLFARLPKLWDIMTSALPYQTVSQLEYESHVWNQEQSAVAVPDGNALVNCLQVVKSLAPALNPSLHSNVLALLPSILACSCHPHALVRRAAAKCLASLCTACPQQVMNALLSWSLPALSDMSSESSRRGSAAVMAELVAVLGSRLIPYAGILVVPLLGRMSDPSPKVRSTVTSSFASLVPLLPLARGASIPLSDLNPLLAARVREDALFLEQLLDNKKVEDYEVKFELKVTLRKYQQEGINWLAFLTRFGLHGILCDDMGLGKTLQASVMLASDTAARAASYATEQKLDSRPLPSLVVCPPTLVPHWAFEIEKFIPSNLLKPIQYIGSGRDRSAAKSKFRSPENEGSGAVVVVTSYELLRSDVEWFESISWNFLVLDEGHIIKSAKSMISQAAKRVKAEHRLILSGTPLQNNVLELWSLFDFLMPGFLGSERQFQSKYGKPLLAARDPKCTAKQAEAGVLALEALHKQVMPFMLRRTKEQVLKDLPPKIIQDRYCQVSALQMVLYEDFSRSQVKNELAELVATNGPEDSSLEEAGKGSSKHVFQALQYLRKLCSHPLLVVSDLAVDKKDAVLKAMGAASIDFHDISHAPKLMALRDVLLECGIGVSDALGDTQVASEDSPALHRVLVFAQLKSFLDIIEKDLFKVHMPSISYLRIDGSVEPKRRFDVVKRFNSDPTIDVLLLTTHVGGLGLNLTSADTVIFVEHDWNPMRDLQAMDRAHRLGQKRSVNVHRLIMRDTLEEKMMSLQRFKLSVANTVVNADNASLSSMDTTQLLDLFNAPQPSDANGGRGKEVGDQSSGLDGGVGKGKGLKAILSSLEELWDESQYAEEYNVDAFLSRLQK